MSIGKRISERREELGLTQEELGRQVGVIKGAVSAWESGATPVSLRRARTLANILSRSVIWLVHGVEPGAIESNQIDGGSIVPRVRMSDVIDLGIIYFSPLTIAGESDTLFSSTRELRK